MKNRSKERKRLLHRGRGDTEGTEKKGKGNDAIAESAEILEEFGGGVGGGNWCGE